MPINPWANQIRLTQAEGIKLCAGPLLLHIGNPAVVWLCTFWNLVGAMAWLGITGQAVAGSCRCAENNPKGRRCLADVRRAVDQAMKRHGLAAPKTRLFVAGSGVRQDQK